MVSRVFWVVGRMFWMVASWFLGVLSGYCLKSKESCMFKSLFWSVDMFKPLTVTMSHSTSDGLHY